MNTAAMATLAPVNWLDLLGYFLTLSLMTVGGAIATAPDMHRYLVDGRHWLSDRVSCAIIVENAPRAKQKHNIFFLFIFNMFLMI